MIASDSSPSASGTQHTTRTRLGLFGGSFNPIHNGHLTIARQARETLELDQILLIPTGDPPHKQSGALAPARHRYEMVRLAINGDPNFSLSDIEIVRPGKSYTIDTVRHLQRQYGPATELFFLIGLDAFIDMPSWREPEALLAACSFVVISRPGQSFCALAELPLLPGVDVDSLASLDAGRLARLDLPLSSGHKVICLPLPPCAVSASDIRRRIRQGASLANLLPLSVESYILQHQLYQEDGDHTHI